ncbi:MAG TPA: hypothetical protein VFR58_09480, partial [Flavisolibacter sp.]|nr:hypothetical protein [Flavisolibacter sp.]
MKRLLLLMLAPTACLAQEVHSVTSQDYLKLIRSDSSRSRLLASDTAYNLQYSKLRTSNNYPGPVRTVVVKSQDLSLTPLVQKLLVFSGNFSTTVEVKQVNQTPALQNEYSQGRSLNGQATWQGPETREVFSFGPLMSELEYDGAGYAYDRNGRLVPAANGNGKKAVKYKNDIFRTGLSTAQFLSVQGRYLVARKQLLAATLRVGRRGESHFMRGNKSRANSLMASVERSFKQHTATASFNQFEEHYTAGNGIGFLSRLYQNALLTPVSFDNSQGSRIGSLQRSYGAFSDNPLFLLEKGSPIMKSNRSAGLQFERKNGQLQYKVSQSLEISRENSGEGYEAGAAFFPSGIAMIRNLRQRSHLTKAKLQYKPQLNISNLHTTISASYIGSWDQSLILYAPGNDYQYKRSSHQLGLSYSTRLERRNFDAGLNLDNNTYSSSTSSVRDLFIPGISGFVMLNTPGPLSIKLSGSAIALNSEPALGNSFRGASLLQYTTADAFEYFPRIEASSVDNLMPIRHRDHAAAIELRYGHKFSLRAEVFSRSISGDVMPVLEGGELLLKNLADHSNTGQEIQLSFLSLKSKLSNAHSLSFFSYRSKVTAAAPGYDGT